VGSPRFAWRRPVLQWGLAAAAVLFLATSAYFLSENVRLRHQVADLRAGVEAGQRQLAQQAQREQTASRAQEPTRPSEPPSRAVIASLVLMPPVRGAGALRTLPLPRSVGDVAVRLALDGDDFPTYRVVLRDAVNGQVVWRSGAIRSVAAGDIKALSFTVGAEILKRRTYTFEVSGVSDRGTVEPVANYPFRAVLD